ncbi:hypothetical protein, partial [Segatella oulorum]|uniref:hypothetical protein n=1 Tax=Segatella oulorum TaxID=28136 RepID=UPI0023F2AB76
LRRRKNPLFFDARPSGAENGHRFLTCNPAAQKILRRYCQTTLRRRNSRGATAKQPCGAENPEALLPNNPAAQKILRRYCQTTLVCRNPIRKSGWMKKASMLHSTLARSIIQVISAMRVFLILNR